MNDYPQKTGKTIAVTGKGGTGKTVLSTLMIKCLADRKILETILDPAI